MTSVVLAAHGTRSPAGQAAYAALLNAVRARLPHLPVDLSFVDVQQPTLAEVVADAPTPPVIVPLFLAAGVHVRHDVPAAAARRPGSAVLLHLGGWAEVEQVHLDRLRGSEPGRAVLVAAGSSDADARAEVAELAARLADRSGRSVVHAFLGGEGPHVDAVLTPEDLVLNHLLAPGHFADRLRERESAHGIPVSAPLLTTATDAMADAISRRVAQFS